MTHNPNRNGSKDKGTRGETGVMRYLISEGFNAKKNPPMGLLDEGDVVSDRLTWQVKAGAQGERASEAQILGWMAQTETQAVRAGSDYGILVTKRVGRSPNRAGDWWAWLPAADLAVLLTPKSGETGRVIYHHNDQIGLVVAYPVRFPLSLLAGLLRFNGYAKEQRCEATTAVSASA